MPMQCQNAMLMLASMCLRVLTQKRVAKKRCCRALKATPQHPFLGKIFPSEKP